MRLACKTAYNLAQLNWSEHPIYNRKIVCSSHTARPTNYFQKKGVNRLGILSWCNHAISANADEAFNKVASGDGRKTVILYRSFQNEKELHNEIKKLYQKIKEYNINVDSVEEQLIPTNPYFWNDIDGCLGVRCAEIDIDTVENCDGKIALFAGWNKSVLFKDTELCVSSKAMASLALLGSLAQ